MSQTAQTQYFTHTLTLSPTSIPASKPQELKLAYTTHGDPSNPAILLPSCYGGKLSTTTPFLWEGPNAPFPPSKFFIITTGLLGGSESSSPSNAHKEDIKGYKFPKVRYQDNINLQYELCQSLGVKNLKAYIGFSMGGMQAYHMSVLYPSFAEHIVVLAGSARCSAHNWSFLEGPKAALVNSVDFHDGKYTTPAKRGTGAFGRVYSTWALSQEWFRQQCWKGAGFDTLEEYLKTNWENGMGSWDANDLLALLDTWQNGDVGKLYKEDGGELEKALKRIEAKVLVMPSRTDTYFPPEDNQVEVKYIKNGTFKVIESIHGHMAGGGGGTAQDEKFIQDNIRSFVLG